MNLSTKTNKLTNLSFSFFCKTNYILNILSRSIYQFLLEQIQKSVNSNYRMAISLTFGSSTFAFGKFTNKTPSRTSAEIFS